MLINFFREGGFAMFPTALFGILLVASAVSAVKGKGGDGLVARMYGLTLGSGVLGTISGIIATCRYLENAKEPNLGLVGAVGLAESLNNVVLALIFCVVASLVSAMGAVKRNRTRAAV
jgi:hypothetical protein